MSDIKRYTINGPAWDLDEAPVGYLVFYDEHLTALNSKWRPIETAPKDGTEVFIWVPDRNDFIRSRFHIWWLNKYGNGPEYQWGKTKLHESGIQVADYQMIEPTHWMPIPKPPEAS